MTLFYNDAVTRYRPATTTNRAGEEVRDWAGLYAALDAGEASELALVRRDLQVRPSSQAEVVAEDRTATVSEWRIASAPWTGDWDIAEEDVVVLPDGTRTKVVGEPARPSNPIGGGLHHVEVLVRKVAG